MNRPGFRAILVACTLGVAALCTAAGETPGGFAVAGYVFPRNSLLKPGQIDAHSVRRIDYAFAAIRDGRLVEGSPADAQNLALLTALRKLNPSLKVLVSVGGWLGSGDFSSLALTAQSRKVFVESVIAFLKRYDLDGLDVDWEYPGEPGAGHAYRPEDKHNFTLLLEDLRGGFDEQEKSTGRRLILTIAAGASEEYLAHTEMKKVQRYVDAINLMTYDYAMPSDDAVTGLIAPLYSDPAAPRQESVDASIRAFELTGVPPGKILLGVPFYGYAWDQVPDQNHGLFQRGKPAPDDFSPFSAIQQDMLGHGFARYWDEAASAPYLYSAEKQQFVTYDDAESLTIKCQYAMAQKLGGVMFWEFSDDPSGALLQVIDRVLREPAAGSR